MIGRFLCWLGLHRWDDHIIAMSCERPGCGRGVRLTFGGWVESNTENEERTL